MLKFVMKRKEQYEVKTEDIFTHSPCVQKLGKIFHVAEAETGQNRKWVWKAGYKLA